jgi:hypothetical protein
MKRLMVIAFWSISGCILFVLAYAFIGTVYFILVSAKVSRPGLISKAAICVGWIVRFAGLF